MQKLNGIALGTFPFANVFGKVNESDAIDIIKRYIDCGGDFIHVSLAYNDCEVEKLLGRALKGVSRDAYKLIACCGWGRVDGKLEKSGKAKDVEECCNGALQRIGVDYLDVLMSHTPDINTPYEDTIDAMAKMQEVGKCKQLCVSNVTIDMLKRYNYSGKVDYIQNRFSLINQDISQEMFDYCDENDIKITTYQSVERGLLTDRVLSGINLSESDLRKKKPEFSDSIQAEIAKWVREYIAPIAERQGMSILSLALSWTLQYRPISSVVCGISKMKYFDDYFVTAQQKLSSVVIGEINNAYEALVADIKNRYGKTVHEFMGLN